MCDSSAVKNWLIVTLVAILSVVGIIVGAIIANSSWFYAFAAPAVMISAAIVTGLALLFLNRAIAALDSFCACAGARCEGPCGNLRRTLMAAGVVLGIQATACISAALIAWIPGVGQGPMYVIIGALIIQTALIISAIAFLAQLGGCQMKPAGAGPAL